MRRIGKYKINRENLLKKALKIQTEHKKFVPAGRSEKKLAERLVSEGLLRKENGGYRLTERGKTEAAAIIRKHRLYETYLAKRTGIDIKDWHRLAENREHHLDEATINKWEKELGFPLVDPHGDPIPDAGGQVEVIESILLNELKPRQATFYKIVHLEDEPEEIYNRLIDKGLYPGVIIRVIFNKDKWQLAFEGLEIEIPEEEARLISVKKVAVDPAYFNLIRLSSLKEGEKGKIIRLSDALFGLTRQRLLDLGFVRNAIVSVYLKAPLREPVAYDIKGSTVALRKEQADKILVIKL